MADGGPQPTFRRIITGAGGCIFFFAHNWSRMNAIAKFGLIEFGLWLCVVGALKRGLERLTGKVLLLAASVLVGVLWDTD